MERMPALSDIVLAGHRDDAHRPWPRVVVDEDAWRAAGDLLAQGDLTLVGLWGAADCVHMALRDDDAATIAVITLACPERRFPSIGRLHPPAIRLERTISDLCGITPEGAP